MGEGGGYAGMGVLGDLDWGGMNDEIVGWLGWGLEQNGSRKGWLLWDVGCRLGEMTHFMIFSALMRVRLK